MHHCHRGYCSSLPIWTSSFLKGITSLPSLHSLAKGKPATVKTVQAIFQVKIPVRTICLIKKKNALQADEYSCRIPDKQLSFTFDISHSGIHSFVIYFCCATALALIIQVIAHIWQFMWSYSMRKPNIT